MIYANFKLFRISLKFKPDLFLNFLHPYPSQVAKLLGKPSLVFSDTEHAKLHHRLTVPFATKIFTPQCYRIDLGEKHVRFQGYMELAYLHPRYFSPNKEILSILGVRENEKYVIVRFVSWEAAHDFGHSGMSLDNKRKAILEMSKYAKVFISAERQLPEDLESYRIKIPFDKIHDAIYYSALLFGESATMASEAAVLGTPSIFMDNDGRGYTDEEEAKYGLVFNFTEDEKNQCAAIEKAVYILKNENSYSEFKNKRNKLLLDCLDTTEFIVEKVEAYDK
jgi:predicted glycosyltransferase